MFDVQVIGKKIYPCCIRRSKRFMSTARARTFELTGADGGPLRGEVRTAGDGTGRPAVVICHGFKGSKDWGFIPILAERLARAGMTAVSFNFSGSGVGADGDGFSEKERFAHSTFSNDVVDIGTICRSIAAGELVEGLVQSSNYGLFGYSRGGGVSVLHAAADPAVRCLVTWAAISHTNRWDEDALARWRSEGTRPLQDAGTGDGLFFYVDMLDDIEKNKDSLDFPRAAARVAAPWLILHGDADEFVPLSEGEELFRAANRPEVELSVVEGGDHLFGLHEGQKNAPPHLESAVDRTLAWFSRYLY
jgi:dienelactone hydrolase